jgi:hypothetical protein
VSVVNWRGWGDVVAHGFELVDGSFLRPFGVESVEVVGAGVVVEAATLAFWGPRRAAIRR